jgi:hypothetical protein
MHTAALAALFVAAAAAPAFADSTEVSLGAMAGGGSVDMYGMRYGTADVGIDISVVRFVSPQLAVGVRTAELVTAAFDGPMKASHPVDRDIPWTLEPTVVGRTIPTRWGAARFGWQASASAGVAWLHTEELCGGGGGLFEEHGGGHACVIVLDRSTALTASAAAGGYAEAYHVTMFVGARASADTGGDRAAGLVANLGASF